MANELLESSPKPPKAKTFKFFEKQNTRYSNFFSHPNILHYMPWNLHHYAKNKLSEWTYWKLIYLGDNIWLLLGDGNLPLRSQEPQTKIPFLKKKEELNLYTTIPLGMEFILEEKTIY